MSFLLQTVNQNTLQTQAGERYLISALIKVDVLLFFYFFFFCRFHLEHEVQLDMNSHALEEGIPAV